MGSMKIMDRTGHTTLEYVQETKEATDAEKTFKEKLAQGYAPFVKLENGEYVQVQRERFDAREDYLLIPAVAGG